MMTNIMLYFDISGTFSCFYKQHEFVVPLVTSPLITDILYIFVISCAAGSHFRPWLLWGLRKETF